MEDDGSLCAMPTALEPLVEKECALNLGGKLAAGEDGEARPRMPATAPTETTIGIITILPIDVPRSLDAAYGLDDVFVGAATQSDGFDISLLSH